MNPISAIRNYVKKAVREIDAQYKENNFVHTPDNVGAMKFDKVFFTRFNSIAVARQQQFNSITIPVDIEINAKAGADMIAAHDKILCDSIALSVTITDRQRFNDLFNGVEVTSITPEEVLSNERWTKVTIAANFEIFTN